MIETVGLGRSYDGHEAVRDLNISVKEGEVFGLLGPNGAGKTTTVRMLACLIGPTSGTAYVGGFEIGKKPDSEHIRGIVGVLPESPGLYESLSAYANLDFYAQLYGVQKDKRRERIEQLLKMMELWERKNEAVATYSKGMKQKIAIARAFVHDPKVVFLDEPTAGLDPQAAVTVREFVLKLKAEGRTVFINSHNLDEVERLCDRIAVMKTTALATGAPQELANRYWGRASTVDLVTFEQRFQDAVSELPFVNEVTRDGNRLVIGLDDPATRNPEIVDTIVHMGGKVSDIGELKRSLEEVYLKLVGGDKR